MDSEGTLMPQAGFRDLADVPVSFADIDLVNDAPRFNCSPATLAMLIDSAHGREGIEFSASMLSKTPRQLLLEASDYYPSTGSMISAHMGTMKHQQINVQRDRLIVEQRFTSKRNPRLSGQIDHTAIVALDDDGTLWLDLYDLKNIKWYSVTLCAKNIWKNHADYAWQLNLCATMMEESTWETASWLVPLAPFGLGARRIRVRNLYLECIPADSSYKHEEEANKLGYPEWQKLIIPIDRKSADETYAVYEKALELRDATLAAGYAPICADRWTNRTIDNLRCRAYCAVKHECIAFSHAHGESHPIAPLDVALSASIAAHQNKDCTRCEATDGPGTGNPLPCSIHSHQMEVTNV
jgi:hypothetical protein